jgi:serine/threonine protein kinase
MDGALMEQGRTRLLDRWKGLWAKWTGRGRRSVTEPSAPLADASRIRTIGRYHVVRELGRGGMGLVYLAEDPFIERQVAIKTTKTALPSGPEAYVAFTRRFFHEARAVGRLSHPSIVAVYDAFLEADRCYLVMEYVDGVSLAGLIRPEKPPSIQTVVKVGYHAAQALEYAHQKGVVHRDVKPANILISQKSEVKLSDFGIASIGGRSADPAGRMSASVQYASPEQLRGEEPTPQSDLFSLGVVMYELLGGRHPFAVDNPVATVFRIISEDPAPVQSLRPDCPESLARIIHQCLHKDPAQRHRSDSQLLGDLSTSFRHLRFIEEELHFTQKFEAVKKLKFFSDFSASELVEVLQASQWVQYEAATRVIQEEDRVEGFHVVVTGKLLVRKKGSAYLVLGPGDAFGRLGGRTPSPHWGTVLAQTRAVVMNLPQAFLDALPPGTLVRFYREFNENLSRQLTAAARGPRVGGS